MALVLVTGASTGLGLATVATLAADGHDVVLHARNESRAPSLENRHSVAEMLFADLSEPTQTAELAVRANALGRFDAVIHNAGVLDGRDVFAVNVVAPYLLTALMTPPLRVVVVSSSMHMSGSTDLDEVDLMSGAGGRPYEDSKLYGTTFAMALASRYSDRQAHAVDPGWVPTRMGGRSAPDSLDEGHRTQAWLATALTADIRPFSGGYWHHGRTRRPHSAAVDAEFQHRLLGRLARHTGLELPAADFGPLAGREGSTHD